MSRYDSGCKVYVGDLGTSASKGEIEDAFRYYGPLRKVWLARNPPGFAFVEFEDRRDAEDAVRGLDGKSICGSRARVEVSNDRVANNRRRGPPPRSRGRSFHSDDRCYECGERGHYARDCRRERKSRRDSRRDRSRSRSRSRSRNRRSRSRSRNRRSRSRSSSKSRSRSRSRRSRSASKKGRSRSRSNNKEGKRTRSHSHSRSRSAPKENGSGKSNKRE